MKKKIVVIFMVMAVVLSGCGNHSAQKKKEETTIPEKIEISTEEKTKDNAVIKNSGKLIIKDGKIIKGKKNWNDFLKKTGNSTNEPTKITIRQYYDDECINSVLNYDGQKYSLQYESERGEEKKYKYLVERRGKLRNAACEDYGFYLVNDDSLTYEQLMWSVLSGNSNDWIDFQTVFMEVTEL